MAEEELKTAAGWAKEFGTPEKKFKDAAKAVPPTKKKGCCSYYSREDAEKIKRCVS